jgi:hypothetical protein
MPWCRHCGCILHLDLDAVERIVAAAPAPANINRQELLDDLDGECATYRTGVMLREAPRDREKAVERIVRALEDGRRLLGDYIRKYGTRHLRPQVTALNRLLKEIRKEDSPALNRIVGVKQQMTLSAVERLVLGLREIYERHYGSEADYTDNKYIDSTTSPFIDFADAVLQEAGIHYDRGSISKTLRKRPKSLTDETAAD